MQTLCLSVPSPRRNLPHIHTHSTLSKPLLHVSHSFSSVKFNPLRVLVNKQKMMVPKKQNGGRLAGVVCSSALLSPHNLHWVSAVSTVILMLVKGTAINRSFLVPLFALQAPASILSWMQGEYGAWSAFLALLVRLFFYIPGELELPFMTLVLVLVAPRQAMNLRGTQAGTLISLVIAAYLAFEHFTKAGGLQKSFNQSSIVATLAVICIAIVPCLLLI